MASPLPPLSRVGHAAFRDARPRPAAAAAVAQGSRRNRPPPQHRLDGRCLRVAPARAANLPGLASVQSVVLDIRARRAPSRSSPTCSSRTPATTSAGTWTAPTAPARPTRTSPCCAPRWSRTWPRGSPAPSWSRRTAPARARSSTPSSPTSEAMIKADRKITSLKQLQGHIWRTGFEGEEIKGVVFDDVPPALERWHASGIKTYIYSSGSREAQRLIFGNTTYGDLRKYLCGFFDTTVGTKREPRSYYEIWQSVGVDRPSQILFLTDVYQEATAANAAGLEVLISIRPGNAPLPENHGFQTITSFAEILT